MYSSELVLEEISAGDEEEAEQRRSHFSGIKLLAFSREAVALAKALLRRQALPAKAENDALHGARCRQRHGILVDLELSAPGQRIAASSYRTGL